MTQEQYISKLGQLVSVMKRINYLSKKIETYQIQAQFKRAKLRQLKKDYIELKQTYEFYEFQTYEDILDEIKNIQQSNDFQESEYLQEQVNELK